MNAVDIQRLLRGVNSYRGTFSCDTLPNKTGLVISNTDPHNLPGEHWIAIYISPDRRYGEYFDSFGRAPNALFTNYMREHCAYWIYNKKQLQSIVSNFCGYYCVYYCLLRSRGIDMNKIVNSFTSDTGFNDVLVHGFICPSYD
jgi:hypothetical protein